MRENLSPRENELRDWLLTGLTQKAIAHKMGITHGTLKVYMSRGICLKLGVRGRAELLAKELDWWRSAGVDR